MTKREKEVNKKSFKEWWIHEDIGLRFLIGVISWICLALFIHFREAAIDELELHSAADRFVISQVDFEFSDDEATFHHRQEAVKAVGTIFKIEDRCLFHIRKELENYLVHSGLWKQELPRICYDEVAKTADSLEDLLKAFRFSDNKTIQKMKELNLDVHHYLLFTPLSEENPITLPPQYWNHLKEISLEKILFYQLPGIHEETVNFVVNFFEQNEWILVSDHRAMNSLKDMIQQNIPQKYTKVKAGVPIIAQGEKVTPRHLAIMHAMKQAISKSKNFWSLFTILGDLLISFILVGITSLYLRRSQKEIWMSVQKLSLFACIFILTLAFAKIVEYSLLQNISHFHEYVRYPLLVPFAAILVTILLGERLALFTTAFMAIILSLTLVVNQGGFLLLNLIASIAVVISTGELHKRKEVFIVCGKSLIGAVPVIICLYLMNNQFPLKLIAIDLFSVTLFLLIIAILVMGLLPLLESLFNIMTDMTLMEYMDPNNELLRQLSLEMPGTYQHSLVLGNLAEIAAQGIGAKGLFCRVATLYHDIGKLTNVQYFTENQQGGVNIHQLLTPMESAQVIISHVLDGEMLAKKYRLPNSFIDVIREHHGTTLVYYFYRKELELKGGDKTLVDEKMFRYPGPKPHSKETGIIMIADAIEAASRSIEKPTEEELTALVDEVVAAKAQDGQFDFCPLTFQEINTIKKTLVRTLIVTRHVRIKYPAQEEPRTET